MADEENAAPVVEEAPPPVEEEAPPAEAPAENEVEKVEEPVEEAAEIPEIVIEEEGDVPLEVEAPVEEEVAVDEVAEQPQEFVEQIEIPGDAEEILDIELEPEKEIEEEYDRMPKLSSFDELEGEFKESMEMESKRQELEKKKMNALGSIISIRRGNLEYFDRSKIPKYMNSYRLEADKPFNPEKVETILKEVLIEALDELTYDADKVPKQAIWASSAIRAKVKEQEYDRYKIVCIVSIGEKQSQDTYSMFRFLWDADRDRYATYVHENMTLFAIAMCFGLYFE